MNLIEIIFQLIGFLGALLAVYSFLEEREEIKIVSITLGIFLIVIYTKWIIREYFTKQFERLENNLNTEIKQLKNKMEKSDKSINWIKGWISGKKGIIDPITLILITALIIIIILILQDKI